MFSCTPVPRSSLLPAKSWPHDHAAGTTSRSTTFVIKEDPFAFTEASSSMWSSNDPIRVIEVAKRQRLSALTEKVEEKRREDRANIEEIDQSQLPSSSTTSDRSGTSSSRYSSFRFTTSLEPVLPNDLEEDAMDVARNSAKRKIEEDAAEDGNLRKGMEKKEPKRRRIEIPAGPAAPPAAPLSTQPTTPSSPSKPKVYKRRNASPPSTSSISATRPISSPPRVQDTQRKRVLATTATVPTTPSKHDSPSPSGSSPQPSTPPINKPPIKFATPQRNLTLKQRASDSTGSPTATATADSTTPKPTTPERPSATRFRVADRFAAPSSSPRSTTSGSLAPPNLGELTRMLRSTHSSSPSATTTPSSSQLLSSSPFKQLRLASSPSSSSSSYSPSSSSPSSLLPSSSSFASTHQRSPRSPEKQLSSTVEQEMRRFRRTQETRVRNFQAEVRQGLSPFRGRKLFPEPEIDDDAILPPIVKPEPRDEEDNDNDDNHNNNKEQDHHPLHHTEAAGLMDIAATTTGQEEPHSGGCAHNSSDAIVLD